MQFGDALMSDSRGSDASTCVPQAHDDFSGRLRGTVAGGPDSSSASMAQMEAIQFNSGLPDNQITMTEAATDANMRQHHGGGDR